ncbi:MAG: histidine kinase [Streptosporangiaceae bacterium]
MGILVKLLWIKLWWRMLRRLLRCLGWGAVLVPVAAVGMAVFGVSLWTIAAVALAVVVAVRRPAEAAALVPVTMLCMGISALMVAAAMPGFTGGWAQASVLVARPVTIMMRLSGAVPVQPGSETAIRGATPGEAARQGKAAGWAYLVLPGNLARPAVIDAPPAGMAGQNSWRLLKGGPPATIVHRNPGPAGPVLRPGPIQKSFVPADRGPWRGRLLVPLGLLLLTLGLWLFPRTLARLRARADSLAPDLRAWVLANRWAVLLVPVSLIGLTVFGVRPWTVAAVLAALIVVARWPRIAADLVPIALAAFAVRGFMIAASWASPAEGPGPAVMFGAVPVDSRSAALLAGAEASAFLAFGAWLVPRTIGAHLRTLLARGTDADLASRVQQLTETRGHAIDAATSELRRIERDLHDGAQARLVALGMNLRAVERMLPGSPQAALGLVAEARETSLRALNELRDLIRGIYPPVLADRGLGHAVRALALDAPLPTELDIDLPGRLTAPVESACYFAVAEALANAVKHSGARRVHIRIQHRAGILRIEVADDGAGGADPARGTGLRGVERRLGTFDGILAVSSPPGGPTMIVMEVPCALSSPATCSC